MPRRLSDDLDRALNALLDTELPTDEIQTQLESRFGEARPDERTIRRRRAARLSGGPVWSVAHASADEAELVPPVLRAIMERTRGRKRSLTRDEARLIANIARAAPALRTDPFRLYELAREYVYSLTLYGTGALRGRPAGRLEALDAYLAYAPWTSAKAMDEYLRAFDAGWIAIPGSIVPPGKPLERQQQQVRDLSKGKKAFTKKAFTKRWPIAQIVLVDEPTGKVTREYPEGGEGGQRDKKG